MRFYLLNMCTISKHLIFECANVEHTWKLWAIFWVVMLNGNSSLLVFTAVRNDTTAINNLLLSLVALQIYKINIRCLVD